MKRYIIIWFVPKKNQYYYKNVHGFYQRYFNDYKVGFINQYNHKIVLIIDTYDKKIGLKSFKIKIIDNIISWLERKKKVE